MSCVESREYVRAGRLDLVNRLRETFTHGYAVCGRKLSCVVVCPVQCRTHASEVRGEKYWVAEADVLKQREYVQVVVRANYLSNFNVTSP